MGIPRQNAFLAVRYLLALSLIGVHYHILACGAVDSFGITKNVVDGFFVLSAFLTFHSFGRGGFSAKSYALRRTLRLYPAYVAVVLVCFVGGVFLTTLSAWDYFTNGETWRYLGANLSFLNFLSPTLPGVFADNAHMAMVNGSLWTMKVEVMFYLVAPFLFRLCRGPRRTATILVSLMLLAVVWREGLTMLYFRTGNELFRVLSYQFVAQMLPFGAGMALYFAFGWVKRHARVVFFASSCAFVCTLVWYELYPLQCPAFAVLLVLLAYADFRPLWAVNRLPNLTYGLFLWHFPVIQTLIALGVTDQNLWLGLLYAGLITLGLAYAQHRLIEKPVERYLRTHL